MDSNEVKVGIGDFNVVMPPDKLITLGLGSCVGIVLYDKRKRIAGLAHIMLPDSAGFSRNNNPLKFADKAIPELLNSMEKKGANKNDIWAKIAGGANMFSFTQKNSTLDIGSRNGRAVKNILNELNIKLIAEDLGGNSGRTIIVESETGKVFIKTVDRKLKEL